MKRVLVVLGTRPEAIKLWPVIRALEARKVPVDVASTGQQKDLLEPLLWDLEIMPVRTLVWTQPLITGSSSAVRFVAEILEEDIERYGLVLVQGDTASTFAGAFAGFLLGIPVGHVEAGLRTYNCKSPFPEEGLRQMISRIATLHFAPTEKAFENLIAERLILNPELGLIRAYRTGNTVVDALDRMAKRVSAVEEPAFDVLVTFHRRESWPETEKVAQAIMRCASELRLRIRWALHANPELRARIQVAMSEARNAYSHHRPFGVWLVEPLGYCEFLRALRSARCVVTDSGGVIEEATTLGRPLVILRDECERKEAQSAHFVRLDRIHTLPGVVAKALSEGPSPRSEAFGDGHAAKRIATIVHEFLW